MAIRRFDQDTPDPSHPIPGTPRRSTRGPGEDRTVGRYRDLHAHLTDTGGMRLVVREFVDRVT